MVVGESRGAESQLFEAITAKDLEKIKHLVDSYRNLNLNCIDGDELTPLQHACHSGDVELTKFLIRNGASVNFTRRKDNYTPLMFAAISSKPNVVRLLLENHADITAENCVNRTAAQMAAFVGQSKIVAIINGWVPYASSVEPFTKCRELEDKPRISSPSLGNLLHQYIIYPSLHPIKLLLYIKDNTTLVKYAAEFIYVLETLASKALKPPDKDESLSLKYYYLSYLVQQCQKSLDVSASGEDFDEKNCEKSIDVLVRKLIKRDNLAEIRSCTKQLDHFIMECMMKFPYTQLAIFKTITFALTKREPGDLSALSILTQTLNGPRMFGHSAEACTVCGEVDRNKKCSRCKMVYYCGSACQRADWFQHRRICKCPEETPLLQACHTSR